MRGSDISYAKAESLLAKAGLRATWDEREKSPYAFWSNAGVYEHLWIEDARAFLGGQGIDVDAIAPQIEGRFMSSFIRAVKPAACCAPGCCV